MDKNTQIHKYNFIYNLDNQDRVDHFLSDNIEGHSRSFYQKCIKGGFLTVNGKLVKSNYKLKNFDKIEFTIPPPEPPEPEPQNIPINIVYEDEHILVINKQTDLVVHPAPGNPDNTLVNALLYHIKDLSGIGGVIRPGIVHRLDKDTSGLMLIAKSDAAHTILSERIKNREVKRIYQAIVWGIPKENHATIDAPIGRNPKDNFYWTVNYKNGKPARTYYETIEIFKYFSLLRLSLETGRTHQIRVHLLHIKHPVVGDPVYFIKTTNEQEAILKKECPKIYSALKSINRQILHSSEIYFNHPLTNQPLFFKSIPPDDFTSFLNLLFKYNKGF